MSKEKPILFKDEMVRAILSGQKTQTRRTIDWKRLHKQAGLSFPTKCRLAWFKAMKAWGLDAGDDVIREVTCPYGEVGDRLWVRETWRQFAAGDECGCSEAPCGCPDSGTVLFRADGDDSESRWRPSIHMPRWASRITLEITDVRVERLQDISEDDARAEGVQPFRGGYWRNYQPGWTQHTLAAKGSFLSLWNSINGPDSWDANPFVWVIEFKQVTA
ncbi:hypothetical protein AWH63_06755 [Marinobacter sp. C18]|uniref:hypothetical protein n=1 Tax=Marinobacter sp. C18 TaxID=1772288 RepID=UPI000949133F|nr:hypothetical protein [Marinobacter sp. C18]OLF82699.1 hypothetical protein AWH63_06755 [Marinobacter sp. C18]